MKTTEVFSRYQKGWTVARVFRDPAILHPMLPPPPRGAPVKPTRPELPREFIAVRKRRRMMDAMAELTARTGLRGDQDRRHRPPRRRRPQNALRQLRRQGRGFPRRLRRRRRARWRSGSRRPARRSAGAGATAVEAGLRGLSHLRGRAARRRAHVHDRGDCRQPRLPSARYDEAMQRVRRHAARERPRRDRPARRRPRRPWSGAWPGSCTSRSVAARPSRRSI